MNQPSHTPTLVGLHLRTVADDMWPDTTVTIRTAFGGGFTLIAANKAATATATAIWFTGAVLTTASNIAMPVAAQYVLLVVGILGTIIGTGILGRFALLAAVNATPSARTAIRYDRTAQAYAIMTLVIAAAALVVFGILVAVSNANPTVTQAATGIIALMAIATAFAPANAALGDNLTSAIARSARTITTPRLAVIAIFALVLFAVSSTIPILGLILMPWQVATIAYVRTREPAAKQATPIS